MDWIAAAVQRQTWDLKVVHTILDDQGFNSLRALGKLLTTQVQGVV